MDLPDASSRLSSSRASFHTVSMRRYGHREAKFPCDCFASAVGFGVGRALGNVLCQKACRHELLISPVSLGSCAFRKEAHNCPCGMNRHHFPRLSMRQVHKPSNNGLDERSWHMPILPSGHNTCIVASRAFCRDAHLERTETPHEKRIWEQAHLIMLPHVQCFYR